MKRLVRSTKTGIFCIQCDKLIPVNTSRIIDGQMHNCLGCVNKTKPAKISTFGRVISWIKGG